MPELEPVELAGDGFLLRPFRAQDEPAVGQALGDPDILRWTAGSAVVRTPAPERAKRWLEPRLTGWTRGHAAFAIADDSTGELLGSVTLRDVHRVPDQAVASYWVSPVARGLGLAGRALARAAGWAFASDGLGLHRLSLDHALVNQGSCRVATRAGFQLEGVMRDYYVEPDGRRHDSHLHARLATDQLPRETAGS